MEFDFVHNEPGHLNETAGAKTPSRSVIWKVQGIVGSPLWSKDHRVKDHGGGGSRLTGFSSIIRRSDFTMGKKPVTCSLIRDVDYLNLVLLLN